MKLMSPEKRLAKLYFPFALILILFSVNLQAQSRKTTPAKKTVVKKNQKQARDARKDSKNKATAKTTRKDARKEKALAKAAAKQKANKKDTNRKEKLTAKDRAREKDAKSKDTRNKKDPKKVAESRRERAERKRAEEARRQAALAEQRRREQAAREARARKLAFERGLRNETAENILKDNIEGEDLSVRRAAVNALGSRAGTVVVMEAQTGKVLTIVNQEWAIKHGFKPCSTIKLVTGVAGLNENIIDDDGNIRNSSTSWDLDSALARSNNGYFQRVGSNMGSTKMIDYAKRLGLGETTGINADGETAGRLPYGNNNARIYSHGDDFEVTPLQLAVMVSAISNGGRKVVPQISRPRSERTNFKPHLSEQVSVPQKNVEGVLPGMIGAAEYGTARRGVDSSMHVAGKTGSCIAKGSWVGLFASVAPVEDPKYSVVVITRGQGERGKYAAAVAGKVYQALNSRIPRNNDLYMARKRQGASTRLDTRTAIVSDEDEDEDDVEADENGVASGDEQPIVVGQGPIQVAPQQPVIKKIVRKTADSKPVFPTVVIQYDRSGAEKAQRPRIVKNK